MPVCGLYGCGYGYRLRYCVICDWLLCNVGGVIMEVFAKDVCPGMEISDNGRWFFVYDVIHVGDYTYMSLTDVNSNKLYLFCKYYCMARFLRGH